MLFVEFANKLYPIIGAGKQVGDFTRELFENMMTYEEAEDCAALDKVPSSFKAYYTGQNTINRISRSIMSIIEPECFVNYINGFKEEAQLQILKDFSYDIPEMNKSNIAECIADLFKNIIVTASKIGRSKAKNKGQVVEHAIGENDLELLEECDSCCPVCDCSFSINDNGNIKFSYRHLYIIDAESIDEKNVIEEKLGVKTPIRVGKPENELLVCEECFLNLSSLKEEKAEKIYSIKTALQERTKIREIIKEEKVEEGVREILMRLEKLPDTQIKEESLDVHKVESKIPNDALLRKRILDYVVAYYHFIKETFNELQSEGRLRFNKVRNEVSQTFENLDEMGLSQQIIFDKLVEWLMEGTKSDNKIACEIIIAFFVQNCEVFYEIPE